MSEGSMLFGIVVIQSVRVDRVILVVECCLK